MTRRSALAGLAFAIPAWGRSRAPFERSFLQPWRSHLAWSASEWSRLLDWLDALRARTLVLQWTSWNGIDYSSLAARLAPMLAERRMKLWLGLAFDEEFWRWPAFTDDEAAGRLAAWRERSLALAARLARGGSDSPARSRAFAGWYLPEEFDAARWRHSASAVAAHLSATRAALARIAKARVASSGFPSASEELAASFWSRALAGRAADELWMQDGIGAGKITLESWPSWGRLVSSAVRRTRCRLSVVVETFEVLEGPEFRAQPAPAGRLRLQLAAAEGISRGPLVAFDIASYMAPAAGSQALRLGLDYAAAAGLKVPPHLLSIPGSEIR
jgi:hypothetical protein